MKRFAHKMVGFTHTTMRPNPLLMLLLSVITTGVSGMTELISAGRSYKLTYPCMEDLVCYHIWQMNPTESEFVAIVSNGKLQLQTAASKEDKCTLDIPHFTEEDVGQHRCQHRLDDSSSRHIPPVINLLPTKSVTLQCVFLRFVEKRLCSTRLKELVQLTWVDEAGEEIQADPQHKIYRSPCDVTLTVTYQTPGNMKFLCRATVDRVVLSSVELQVRAVAPKGKGRGLIVDLGPENQGSHKDTIGAAVGVVGCVVLASAVAVFVVNRRRTSIQLHNEPGSDLSSSCNDINTDDVIYADIVHPDEEPGTDQVWILEDEHTEYACVRYK